MFMVEVFITDVQLAQEAEMLLAEIHGSFQNCEANFDLEDCDRVLRIEGNHFRPDLVIMLLNEKGLECSILE